MKRRFALTFALAALAAARLSADDFQDARVYPNPARASQNVQAVTFDQLPNGSVVRIYDEQGRLVKEGSSEGGTYVWPLTNLSDQRVASGIYFYALDNGSGQKKTGKIGVIR